MTRYSVLLGMIHFLYCIRFMLAVSGIHLSAVRVDW